MNPFTRLVPGVLRLAGLSIAAMAWSAVASIAACERAVVPEAQAEGAIVVTGEERLQWDQAGPSLEAVRSYRYMAVVGRRPSDLTKVACTAKPSGGGFLCSSELPPLASGVHQVWVIAVVRDGERVLVSRWETPLTLQKR